MALLSSGRALLDAPAVLVRAGLTAGMQYADLGSGPLGHFVFPASDIVGPDGHVYAVDILKSSLSSIESRLRMEGTGNVTLVWGDFERAGGVKVPDHSLQMISVVNIISVLMRTPAALVEIKRLLRPDGKLLLVDWRREKTAIGPPIEHRVAAEDVAAALEKAGFLLKHSFDAGPYHWAQVFGFV